MTREQASELIDAAGGVTAFARLLGLDSRPGYRQLISNWRRRGIPARVELNHQHAISALWNATRHRSAA